MRIILILSYIFLAFITSAQKTILHCGQLIDVKSGTVLKEMTITVEKNVITNVEKGYTNALQNDILINLKNYTVLPGLMDMHVHLTFESNVNSYLEKFTLNPADNAYRSVAFAEKTLMTGFTTVRDLGDLSGNNVNISLRNAINKKIIKGPRIFTAGRMIATTGGHGDVTNSYRRDLMIESDNNGLEAVNGPEECIKAVRQRYKDGSDLIKITASAGVLSVANSAENPQFTDSELKAIVETAKDYGLKVAAHCHGAEAMKRAILAGVNSIEHGTYMTDEIINLMKQKGTYYVPTITAGKSVGELAQKPGYYPEIVAKKALMVAGKIQITFSKAYKAGVKIAFGTDAGVFAHGENWKEFTYMTEAGMPAIEAIQTATLHTADLLGVSDQLGSIEKNKLADIIAVEGDPTKDINAMSKVKFVMKEGIVYKNE